MGNTIGAYGKTEITIQKSRFICQAKRVTSEDEANQFLMDVRKTYWDATHNCYAYVITNHIQKSSDDGEPAGTAGRPILEMIHNNDLNHTAIVVTRYYGGIKLGTGGLVRAYGQGAKAAIETAGILTKHVYQEICIDFDYGLLGKVEQELRSFPTILHAPEYSEKVTWSFWVVSEHVQKLVQRLKDVTAGKLNLQLGKQEEKIDDKE
ncbi:YigZ family protein [Shimazuella kribbensis]|uniref:YigZ family protein n=1 Tax=Shimazuella kribbensis TaxID=139808 RepID=UPI00042A8723|nr:YigZ family protein [Shimazuella kribbensis]